MARDRGSKRWTPAEARGVLDEWKRSGLPLARFARQRGYGPQRLQWWKGQLELRCASARPPLARFVPVELAAPTAPRVAERAPSWIEIALPDGVRLRVPEAVDARSVGRLVAALRGPAC
jgi:hypothetical protein